MSTASLLGELLDRWETLRRQGVPVSLEELCRDQPHLLPELEREQRRLESMDALLGVGKGAEDGCPTPDLNVLNSTRKGQPREGVAAAWPTVPGYDILGELGRGGMGVVYKARQLSLNRVVALKVILDGAHAGPQHVRRFRAEADAVARFRHPNIVQIYEIGEHEGRPYFSLEYMEGGSLAQKHRDTPETPREASRMVEVLARAVHAAHQQGIVHRDLKPSNVLLTADGIPKIADFGLAKRLDAEGLQSYTGEVLGTPSYMAPEQTAGKRQAIGPATDVYGLGAILYELLIGRPPFLGPTPLETILLVTTAEVVPPRRLQPTIPRDLEAVCLKCLEKAPEKRYASAWELADDLHRFLGGEPVFARPVSAVERALKWSRRRPATAALLVVSALALLVLLGGLTYFTAALGEQNAETVKERDKATQAAGTARKAEEIALQRLGEAKQERAKAEINLYFANIGRADQYRFASDLGVAKSLLKGCPSSLKQWEWHYLDRLCNAEVLTCHGHTAPVNCVAFSPDGRHLASVSDDGTMRLWERETGRAGLVLRVPAKEATAAAFSPDGKRLAAGSGDGTVTVWDAVTGKQLLFWKGHRDAVFGLAFAPGGQLLATGSDDATVTIWDAATGEKHRALSGHKGPVRGVAFSPDGEELATGSFDMTVRLWHVGTGRETLCFQGHNRKVSAVAFHADGHQVASASRVVDHRLNDQAELILWERLTGQEVRRISPHRYDVTGLAFSPDGSRLATGSRDRTVRVWDAATGKEVFTVRGPADVYGMSFSPDGKYLACGYQDHVVRVWDAAHGQGPLTVRGEDGAVALSVAFTADGLQLASGGTDGVPRLWDAGTGREVRAFVGHDQQVNGVAFSPDGKRLASASRDKTLKLWGTATGNELLTLLGHTDFVNAVAFHPDGTHLASGGEDHTVRLWDTVTGANSMTLRDHTGKVSCVAFSPDGKRLASGDSANTVIVWDAATGEKLLTFSGHRHEVHAVAFSPCGRYLASGSGRLDPTVIVWEASTGQEVTRCVGHKDKVAAVAFSPDGHRLASASDDKTVRLWERPTGREALSLEGHVGATTSVVFSRDGHRLVSAAWDGTIKIWNGAPR